MTSVRAKAVRQRANELYVEGFQVFEETARIPLRRLTFLFGPNSAGKSAVEDALTLLNEAIQGNSFEGSFTKRFSRLRRHWRRIGDGRFAYAPKLTVGYLGDSFGNVREAVAARLHGAELPSYTASDEAHEVDVQVSFRCENLQEAEFDWDPEPLRDFKVTVGGECLLVMTEFEKFGVNCDHEMVAGLVQADVFARLAVTWPDFVEVQAGWAYFLGDWVRVNEDKHIDQGSLSRSLTWKNRRATQAATSVTEDDFSQGVNRVVKNDGVPREISHGLAELAAAYDAVWDAIVRNLVPALETVPASRKVPSERELMFVVGAELDSFSEKFATATMPPMTSGPDYQPLARSFAALLPTWDPDIHWGDYKLAEKVNQALADYLFSDRGYRVGAEVRLLVPPDRLRVPDGENAEHAGEHFPTLVRLFLVDAQGREFLFEDVGSGLGYVLPVLCALYRESGWLTLLQQPELHLHPALQAALADVLIDATVEGSRPADLPATKFRKLIIETHSEHLLLRALKRVRQSGRQHSVPEGLALASDDVCVLYFEPSLDGRTRVKRLRVSPDGDFLDRWPRGFFTEREGELFDGEE